MKSVPNILTITRIILIPFICMSFYFSDVEFANFYGATIFLLASITDYLDGYLARKYKLQSKFGIIFDPIADKLLVVTLLLMLCTFHKASPIPAALIICREIFISGLREMVSNGKSDGKLDSQIAIPVSTLSKIKTLIQMLAIFLLLIGDIGGEIIRQSGNILLWIAAFLSLYTGLQHYLKYPLP